EGGRSLWARSAHLPSRAAARNRRPDARPANADAPAGERVPTATGRRLGKRRRRRVRTRMPRAAHSASRGARRVRRSPRTPRHIPIVAFRTGSIMNAPLDIPALKTRQQAAWSSGDYAVIGVTLQLVGESLAEACDIRYDERVLDAAARRGGKVTSTDYVSALLERGAERARAERLDVKYEVADAEALPYDDASFDVVLSTFGVMFAPDQATAASELARVCRPGGRIGLANWTPEGFIGQMFKVLGRHLPPPPAGAQPPALWGTEKRLAELFG